MKNCIRIGLRHFKLCLFLFFVKNVNLDQFWKIHKFHKFANFRIKIIQNVASFGLTLKKTFASMISYEKRIRFNFFFFFFFFTYL